MQGGVGRFRGWIAAGLIVGALAWPGVAAADVFTYTGAEQDYIVPSGVSAVHIVAVGAPGASGGGPRGSGDSVSEDYKLPSGQSLLYVEVGGVGSGWPSGAGGWNGGGNGGMVPSGPMAGGGGGGASDVRLASVAAAGSLPTRVIVAGGGGGGSVDGFPGGGAGFPSAQPGIGGFGSLGGGPGTATSGGIGGGFLTGSTCGGGMFVLNGTGGSLGQGGTGAGSPGFGFAPAGGGGGGGGYWGGGGGGVDQSCGVDGGGGGGSDYGDPSALHFAASPDATGTPLVTITAPVPVSSGVPTVAGVPQAGAVLTEGHGAWDGSQTGYQYQWERCNSSGGSCSAIAGATSQSYTTTAADLGSTLRAEEAGINFYGVSALVPSLETSVIKPVLAPVAAFTAPSSGREGVPVAFDAAGSSDPYAGDPITYAWDFGDGSTATGAAPSHPFGAGTHTVKLTVTDAYGLATSITHTIQIADEAPSVAFVAPAGIVGSALAFSAVASDLDGSISSYSWNFGDGSAASGASVSHAFAAPGFYNVILSVTDSAGNAAQAGHTVVVTAPATPPPALMKSAQPHGASAVLTVACSASSTCAGTATATVVEQRLRNAIVGVLARGKKGHPKAKVHDVTVVVGTVGYHVSPGATQQLQLTLNQAGRALMARFFQLTTQLSGLQSTGPITFRYPRIAVRSADLQWLVALGTYSEAFSLVLDPLPRHATVQVICAGGGCPFGRRTLAAHGGRLDVTHLFGKSHLVKGSQVDFKVSAPGYVGEDFVELLTAAAVPAHRIRCMAPGSSRPASCTG